MTGEDWVRVLAVFDVCRSRREDGTSPKLTNHQRREAIRRRDHGEETLAEIGRGYNVNGWTISRLAT